jgi:hypothetical protein
LFILAAGGVALGGGVVLCGGWLGGVVLGGAAALVGAGCGAAAGGFGVVGLWTLVSGVG